MQTREDRIWRHYKSLRKVAATQGFDPNWKWVTLARVWKMPVRQVKEIIAVRKGPTMRPVWCCEFQCFVEPEQDPRNAVTGRLAQKTRRQPARRHS